MGTPAKPINASITGSLLACRRLARLICGGWEGAIAAQDAGRRSVAASATVTSPCSAMCASTLTVKIVYPRAAPVGAFGHLIVRGPDGRAVQRAPVEAGDRCGNVLDVPVEVGSL